MLHITAKHKRNDKVGDFYYNTLFECIKRNGRYFKEFRIIGARVTPLDIKTTNTIGGK